MPSAPFILLWETPFKNNLKEVGAFILTGQPTLEREPLDTLAVFSVGQGWSDAEQVFHCTALNLRMERAQIANGVRTFCWLVVWRGGAGRDAGVPQNGTEARMRFMGTYYAHYWDD